MGWLTGLKALFSGVQGYVLVAALLAFTALAGYAGIEHFRAESATNQVETVKAQKKVVEKERDDIAGNLVQSELDKVELTRELETLNTILAGQRKRTEGLQHDKEVAEQELERVKKTLPQADKDCLARPFPDSLAKFLRDDRPDRSDAPAKDQSAGRPDDAGAGP